MVILVMGPTGAGKTTVGKLLARRLDWVFLDADDFHSEANREKMHRGIPLSEADRGPWLDAIHDELLWKTREGEDIVLACSALRQAYRETLGSGLKMKIVFLRGSPEQLRHNLAARQDHFAGEDLVPSQLATLEEPSDALVEDISLSPEEIVERICSRLSS
jgi:gluconokinase